MKTMRLNVDFIYPIGSVYITTRADVDPAILFGGTWQQTCRSRYMIGAGINVANTDTTYGELAANTLNFTGGTLLGANEVTLTEAQMPSHTHTQKSCTNPGDHAHNTWNYFTFKHAGGSVSTTATGEPGDGRGNATQGAGSHTHTITLNNTGGGSPHNNMPPGEVFYIWKRVA